MEPTCILIDSANQKPIHEISSQDLTTVSHGSWGVSIPKEVLESLHTPVVSPFSALWYYYKQSKEKNTLYLALLENYNYYAVFDDENLLYYEIRDATEHLQEGIEEFLHHFYEQEGSFFVERIKIVSFVENNIDKEQLQEAVLLDIEEIEPDANEICKNEDFLFKPLESEIKQEVSEESEIEKTEEEPKKKSRWNLYFSIVTILIIASLALYEWYLRSSIANYSKKVQNVIAQEEKIGNKNNELKVKLMQLTKIAPVVKTLNEHNKMVIERVREVFNLVGDHTYLLRAEFGKDSLILEGVSTSAIEIKRMDVKLRSRFIEGKVIQSKKGKKIFFKAVYKGGVYAR
ncbi:MULTISPECIES: hypothetical protein [unclassified Nitratiruptor]|uniref:hypothetical protein n=1 Tax=unclassified Nitratiruptor TaxID=2624044 RepID=UPI00191695EE|nr:MULTISPECIES: hypothetical protein [unclassified Nitratiruptor]BCD60783.1 hypothetical protein NitYY0810_C1561 [Nitratiruptor sp. YY08-10]BCD64715.1 hypothetical protein NitYY0814_C1569 [Nitratiruptor sp. YY08-14]